MKYEVLIEPPAELNIERAYLYLCQEASSEIAARWFNRLLDAILSLEELPARCPAAPEDQYFSVDVRQLLVRPYRIIFTTSGSNVHILHVRHMAQRTLTEEE